MMKPCRACELKRNGERTKLPAHTCRIGKDKRTTEFKKPGTLDKFKR